ncbi:MAG: 4'-phosphopantetheinyl transferase superfamily protein [Gammaproteobacteria bacterium]|nr:4'-phosphopantetheinyl transferase superfamily protein [Gammaproteobacteria bacterium]
MNAWHTSNENLSLDDNTIHIWLNYLNIHQARLKHLYPYLSEEEKERSEKFKFFKHRKRFIASHGFMRSVLSTYFHKSAGELKFCYSERGKPELLLTADEPDIRFNLSHSNNLAILAVCKNHPIGIDIEYMGRKNEWAKLIRRFFTPTEQAGIFSLPEKQQKNAFFQVWTRKEAHMKVTGQGLHLAPGQFSVSIPPEPARFIENLKNRTENHWYMQDIILPEMYHDYCGCVSTTNNFESIIHFIHN